MTGPNAVLLHADERCRRRYADVVRAARRQDYVAFLHGQRLYSQALRLWGALVRRSE